MKIKKQVSEIVKQDLKEAAVWYNQARKGLGILFLKEVNKKVKQILKNPLAYEIRYENIRIAFVKRFPYGIHFEYLEIDNRVNILAVFHTSRNPEIWNER